MLPKIHKCLVNTPGRYVDFFIKPFLPSLSAYVQDITDVLSKIKQVKNTGTENFLATMDVEFLYRTIEYKHGFAALRHYLSAQPISEMPPGDFLLSLTEWTLS